MLEQLVSGGSSIFSYSGPGSKQVLEGSRSAGYMGTVDFYEIGRDYHFKEQLGLEFDLTFDTNLRWIKFAYRGKALFIPTRSLASVSFRQLYESGLAWGGVDREAWPNLDRLGLEPVDQDRYLFTRDSTKTLWGYRLRLLRAGSALTLLAEQLGDRIGEPTDLLNRVNNEALAPSNGVKWSTNALTGLTSINAITANIVTGESGDQASYVNTHNTQRLEATGLDWVGAWLPVLEIISLEGVPIPLETVAAMYRQPKPIDYQAQVGGGNPEHLHVDPLIIHTAQFRSSLTPIEFTVLDQRDVRHTDATAITMHRFRPGLTPIDFTTEHS